MEAGDSTEQHLPEYDFDPDKLNLRVRVTLAAERKSVDPVVEQVMQAVREMKCVNGKEDAIELALAEALANAVVHGAKEDPSKVVECLVACDEQRGHEQPDQAPPAVDHENQHDGSDGDADQQYLDQLVLDFIHEEQGLSHLKNANDRSVCV